jgi:arylsulfatase A-like enzyme
MTWHKVLLLVGAVAVFLSARAGAAEKLNPPQKVNILFVIADDASHFGASGCSWVKTPHIDRLAQRGIVFDSAYTPTAKCAPSRAAILTGRNPWQLEEAGNHQAIFPPKLKVFTEAMAAAGLNVGATGKFWGPGLALTADGQPRTWGLQTPAGKKKQGGGFAAFLQARDKAKPFFFWYGSHNPHRPYKLGAGLAAGKQTAEVTHVPGCWPDNEVVRGDMLDYATEVEAFDAEVGECLRALEAAGLAENTLIIVTSDNGMPFPRSKGHTYDIANHMPFVACWPHGIQKPGTHCGEFISFIDLAPTFFELLGVAAEKTGMASITGRSFTDLLRGKPEHDRSFVIVGRERTDVRARPGTEAGLGYPSRAIREGQLYYIHNFAPDRWPCGNPELDLLDTDKGPTKKLIEDLKPGNRYWELSFGKRPAEELFDLAADPDCLKNLATDAAYRDKLTALREKLFAELKRQNDPRILGQGDVFDRYPTAKGKKP